MRSTQKAQMSLIMLLVIAIAIMFYAVSANWARISAYKTQVTIAANTGATTMASMVASYGEYFLQEKMDHKLVQTDDTAGFFKIILAVILVIVAVVVTIVTWGVGGTIGAMLLGVAISFMGSAAYATYDAIKEVGWTQPGLTKDWKLAMDGIPSMEGKFVEQAIQGMFQGTVNDTTKVDDRYDMDMDGQWYIEEESSGDPAAGKLPRFAHYYTNRLSFSQPTSPMQALQKVLVDMQIYLGLPQYGDPGCYIIENPPLDPPQLKPQCNPCCQEPALRPDSCNKQIPFIPACAHPVETPQCTTSNLNACYVYDPLYYEKGSVPANGFMSTLGYDDTDAQMKKTSAGQIIPEVAPFTPVIRIGMGGHFYDGGVFRGTDATGKIFPWLWTLADTKPFVNSMSWADVDATAPGCHWRAKDASGVPVCSTEITAVAPSTIGKKYYRPETSIAYSQLVLPAADGGACQSIDCFINAFKKTVAGDPTDLANYDARKIDKVPEIAPLTPVGDDVCSQYVPGQYWKKGADRLTQTFIDKNPPVWWRPREYPQVEPIKHMDGLSSFKATQSCLAPPIPHDPPLESQCTCSNAGGEKERWRDDVFDAFSVDLLKFSDTAFSIIATNPGPLSSLANFTKIMISLLTEETLALDQMADRIDALTPQLDAWLAGTGAYNYQDDNAWCVPVESGGEYYSKMAQPEKDAIGAGTDPSTGYPPEWGSLYSVYNCQDYNKGNYTKFATCYDNCTSSNTAPCTNLPRSLVPNFNANVGVNCTNHSTAYMLNIKDSRDLARKQSRKFSKRSQYLLDLHTRTIEARNAFKQARQFLKTPLVTTDPLIINNVGFLTIQPNGYTLNQINAMTPTQMVRAIVNWINAHSADAQPGLGNDVIYGWFSDPAKNDSREYGSLHLVRLQASVPGYRKNLLSTFPKTQQLAQVLPWIDVDTNWCNTKRTYTFKENAGYVAARVIRYDEDHRSALSFLSGLPIWKMLYGNPQAGASPANKVQEVYGACTKHFKKVASGGQTTYIEDFDSNVAPFKNAFLLDMPLVLPTNKTDVITCTNAVTELLKHGVVSETCVWYGPKCDTNGENCTYDLKFVSCKQ